MKRNVNVLIGNAITESLTTGINPASEFFLLPDHNDTHCVNSFRQSSKVTKKRPPIRVHRRFAAKAVVCSKKYVKLSHHAYVTGLGWLTVRGQLSPMEPSKGLGSSARRTDGSESGRELGTSATRKCISGLGTSNLPIVFDGDLNVTADVSSDIKHVTDHQRCFTAKFALSNKLRELSTWQILFLQT